MIFLIHALLLLVSSSRATSYKNVTWIYPPGCEYCNTDLSIRYGDAMNVVWTSTWQVANDQNGLELWCGQDNLRLLQITVPNSGNYTVEFANLNLGNDSLPIQCHWSLGVGEYTGNGSSYFEVINQDPNLAAKTWSATASPSSTISSTSDPTPASTTPAGDNSGGGTSAPSAAAQTSSPPSSLSTGAKAGIGVGSVVGGLAILAALGIIIFGTRRRRRQKRRRRQPQQQSQDTMSAEKTSFPSSPSDDLTDQGPHGLYSRKAELDAGQTKYEAVATGDDQETRHARELDAAASNNVASRAELEADGGSHQLD